MRANAFPLEANLIVYEFSWFSEENQFYSYQFGDHSDLGPEYSSCVLLSRAFMPDPALFESNSTQHDAV